MFKTVDLDTASNQKIIDVIKFNNHESARIKREMETIKKAYDCIVPEKEFKTEVVDSEERVTTESDEYLEMVLEAEELKEQLDGLVIDDDLAKNVFDLFHSNSFSDPNRVLMRVIADYHKKIIDTSKALRELIGEMSVDEILLTRKEIDFYKSIKKSLLDVYKENNKSSFILIPNEDGNIKSLLSIKKLTSNQRTELLNILNQVSMGVDYRDVDNKVTYAGTDDLGVIYARLNDRHIALIDIVCDRKKDNKIINHFNHIRGKILNNLDNPSFVSEQEKILDKMYSTLKGDKPYQYKKVN